jgi:hypothetical protein
MACVARETASSFSSSEAWQLQLPVLSGRLYGLFKSRRGRKPERDFFRVGVCRSIKYLTHTPQILLEMRVLSLYFLGPYDEPAHAAGRVSSRRMQ